MGITRRIISFSLVLFLFSWGGAQADSAYKPTGAPAKESVFIFGPHPYSNPQDVFEDYEPIMRYLERKLPGTHFQIEASKNYADYEAKLAAQHFHFSLPNPYQTVFSLEHGYRVIAKMTPDEDFRGLIVARIDKNLHSAHDLSGKTLCFPSATAVAATMLPLLYLQEVQGVAVKQDIQIRYVGSQFSSLLNAYTGDATACGTSVRFWRTWSKENPDKAKQMRVLWKTEPLPHNAIIARSDIDPKLAQQVASVLAGMDKDKELDQQQFKVGQQHFELASNASYKPMQDFLRRYDQAIGLPPAMKTQNSK
ncbi:phosphate/phosphite/phosphonate ABC transporter substrate-binding protein [Sulfuricella sp.]|uniref:phosphate/phosphite/phosphonate ABC transporter substrate-binding protein n=1 Tax=Sulfuricella sp. TaxID=2099377 RepID=UPI002BF5DA70|nr:phosphate/phosphite/phosphonate ABC transporter substrate-binding protein [Sulfuricella sp.]HUX62946.1 phosphate/phosphite/phosphonate ABC transporter substrate-binding protein [Sulfuricella sp.]